MNSTFPDILDGWYYSKELTKKAHIIFTLQKEDKLCRYQKIFDIADDKLKNNRDFVFYFLNHIEDLEIQIEITRSLSSDLKNSKYFLVHFLEEIKSLELRKFYYTIDNNFELAHIEAYRIVNLLTNIDDLNFRNALYQKLSYEHKTNPKIFNLILPFDENLIYNFPNYWKYPYLFKNLSKDFLDNIDFAMSMIRKNIYVIDYFSDKVTSSPGIIKELAACINKKLQFYKQSKLRYNRAYVLHAVSVYGRTLEFACKELQDDEEIVRKSIVYSARSIQYASYRLRMDTNILLLALGTNLNCIPYIPSKKIGDAFIKKYWRRMTLEQKENESLSLTMLFHLGNIEEGNSYPKEVTKNLFRKVLTPWYYLSEHLPDFRLIFCLR